MHYQVAHKITKKNKYKVAMFGESGRALSEMLQGPAISPSDTQPSCAGLKIQWSGSGAARATRATSCGVEQACGVRILTQELCMQDMNSIPFESALRLLK